MPARAHASTRASPRGRYGPTVVATTRAERASAARDSGSPESAVRSGQPAATSPSPARTSASRAGDRPASAILVPAGACPAR